MVADHGRMATLLNEFFCSVFTEEDTTSLPHVEKLDQGLELKTVVIQASQVEKKLHNLKPSSAPGPDKLWHVFSNILLMSSAIHLL